MAPRAKNDQIFEFFAISEHRFRKPHAAPSFFNYHAKNLRGCSNTPHPPSWARVKSPATRSPCTTIEKYYHLPISLSNLLCGVILRSRSNQEIYEKHKFHMILVRFYLLLDCSSELSTLSFLPNLYRIVPSSHHINNNINRRHSHPLI